MNNYDVILPFWIIERQRRVRLFLGICNVLD